MRPHCHRERQGCPRICILNHTIPGLSHQRDLPLIPSQKASLEEQLQAASAALASSRGVEDTVVELTAQLEEAQAAYRMASDQLQAAQEQLQAVQQAAEEAGAERDAVAQERDRLASQKERAVQELKEALAAQEDAEAQAQEVAEELATVRRQLAAALAAQDEGVGELEEQHRQSLAQYDEKLANVQQQLQVGFCTGFSTLLVL